MEINLTPTEMKVSFSLETGEITDRSWGGWTGISEDFMKQMRAAEVSAFKFHYQHDIQQNNFAGYSMQGMFSPTAKCESNGKSLISKLKMSTCLMSLDKALQDD